MYSSPYACSTSKDWSQTQGLLPQRFGWPELRGRARRSTTGARRRLSTVVGNASRRRWWTDRERRPVRPLPAGCRLGKTCDSAMIDRPSAHPQCTLLPPAPGQRARGRRPGLPLPAGDHPGAGYRQPLHSRSPGCRVGARPRRPRDPHLCRWISAEQGCAFGPLWPWRGPGRPPRRRPVSPPTLHCGQSARRGRVPLDPLWTARGGSATDPGGDASSCRRGDVIDEPLDRAGSAASRDHGNCPHATVAAATAQPGHPLRAPRTPSSAGPAPPPATPQPGAGRAHGLPRDVDVRVAGDQHMGAGHPLGDAALLRPGDEVVDETPEAPARTRAEGFHRGLKLQVHSGQWLDHHRLHPQVVPPDPLDQRGVVDTLTEIRESPGPRRPDRAARPRTAGRATPRAPRANRCDPRPPRPAAGRRSVAGTP